MFIYLSARCDLGLTYHTSIYAVLYALSTALMHARKRCCRDVERVDKMAEYVARNGGNFEEMVREREKDNQMLSFLFSGALHE